MPVHRPQGFTWPELAAVLAILGLLAGFALPALGEAVARHRLQIAGESLLDALNQARFMAVRRGHRITVCASDDGHTCSPRSDWTKGWIGSDRDQGTLFEVMGTLDRRLAVARRTGRYSIDFDKSGTTPGSNQTITFCVRGRPSTAFSVIVANSGLARRASASAADAGSCAAPSRKR